MMSSNHILSSKGKTIYFAINLLLLFGYYFFISRFDDQVKYEGDSIDYQTLAVNFSQGKGFMNEGYYSDFSTYKFDISREDQIKVSEQTRTIKAKNFLRNPVYPFFLGICYKMVGVSPYFVKLLQLCMLLLTSSAFFVIFKFMKSEFFLVKSIAASWIFMQCTYRSANEILTEPLLCLIMAGLLVSFFLYREKKQKYWLVLGIMLGLGCLSKGIFYFVFIALFFSEILDSKKRGWRKINKNYLKVMATCVIFILPYLIWQNMNQVDSPDLLRLKQLMSIADESKNSSDFYNRVLNSKDKRFRQEVVPYKEAILQNNLDFVKFNLSKWYNERKKYVYITYQGPDVLLASNNELCRDGGWHKEWINNPSLYYNQHRSQVGVLSKITGFYRQAPELILPIFLNKFSNVFLKDPIPRVFVFLTVFCALLLIKNRPLFVALGSFFIYSLVRSFWVDFPLLGMDLLIYSVVFLAFIFSLFILLKQEGFDHLKVIRPFIAAALLMTLVFYGYFRIIMPFYLIFCLFTVELSILFIRQASQKFS